MSDKDLMILSFGKEKSWIYDSLVTLGIPDEEASHSERSIFVDILQAMHLCVRVEDDTPDDKKQSTLYFPSFVQQSVHDMKMARNVPSNKYWRVGRRFRMPQRKPLQLFRAGFAFKVTAALSQYCHDLFRKNLWRVTMNLCLKHLVVEARDASKVLQRKVILSMHTLDLSSMEVIEKLSDANNTDIEWFDLVVCCIATDGDNGSSDANNDAKILLDSIRRDVLNKHESRLDVSKTQQPSGSDADADID
ncbi:MAG: hypothetical protein VW270_29650, partial [Candidatus Poseidoniales archaeon]